MTGMIVVFPGREHAAGIRNLLVRGGFDVRGVCLTGAQALQCAETMDDGIVICGYRLTDMLYSELREYLPDAFEMLLVASRDKWSCGDAEGVMGLSMPLKVHDLMNTVELLLHTIEQRRIRKRKEPKSRNPVQQENIKKAKELLIERNQMSEGEAHRYLQKCSMDSGTNMSETAEMVLGMMDVSSG